MIRPVGSKQVPIQTEIKTEIKTEGKLENSHPATTEQASAVKKHFPELKSEMEISARIRQTELMGAQNIASIGPILTGGGILRQWGSTFVDQTGALHHARIEVWENGAWTLFVDNQQVQSGKAQMIRQNPYSVVFSMEPIDSDVTMVWPYSDFVVTNRLAPGSPPMIFRPL